MTRLSVDEAQAIVDDIRVTNGGLSPEAERGLSQEAKRALRNLQSIAGGSIVHVAQDLYDKDTRFIYEMIQNAEDNRYTRALKDKKEPFLHFTLYDDRITVDSNEDGFSESDVRAICSIHQSSKKQTSGYIGHKGIGFKSVFKIAPKVTIQSASFCFFFRHTQGDSGMGMITPYNESHEALPAAVTTRITLDLKSPTDFEARAREFDDVPDTLLLFLRQLRNLTLDVVPRGSKTVYKRLEPSRHRVKLVKQIGYNEHYNHYVFKKKTLTGLPQHSSRPGSDEAEVILAFPVDEDSCPLIQPQYVYSFLPMRHEGFNFLIQSDFITQANRLGVHLCPRNEAIRQGICNLFVRTVLGMSAADSELRFEWLQYLPGPHIYDPFWSELREMIFDKLKISKVLLSGEGRLDYPDDLRHLQPFHCLPTGAPVFDDITPELYLSGGYNWTRDEDRLRQLGASNLTYDEALDRLEPYLDGPFPRLLHLDMLPLWHTRVAKLLLRALRKEGRSSRIVKRIKRLPLVPTVRLSLVSPISHSVYFPADEEGNAIPDDLNNLRIVQSSALECPHRRELIETLGVNHCKPNKVARSILKRYNHRHDSITLRNSVDHLRYLFKTMEHDEDLDKRIFIMNEHEQRIYRVFVTLGVDIVIDDVYFETMGEYGTRAICDKLKSSSDSVNDESQYDMHILHEDYIESVPAGIIVHGRTWEQWLEEVAQVRRVPRLKHRRGDNMSQLSKHLADHDPVTLLGMLKTYIKAYIQELTPGVIQGLRTMSVPCQNDYTQDLEATYFPSRELTGLCSTATLDTVFDGFLDIPPRLVTDDVRGWEFLAELGVTLEPEIIFFSDLLSLLLDKHTGGEDTENAYFGIYKELFFRFPNMDELLEGIFEDGFRAVYVPGGILARAEVVELEECVWNGDPCLRRTVPLATYTEYANSPHAVGLFRDRLLLPDADIQTYIRELHWYKDNTDVSKDDIPEIYRAISEQLDTPEDCDLVLAEFTSSSLLFISETQEWVVPASCVWTDAAKLGTKYGLKNEYPELEDFFCDALSIPAPNATNYIEELKELITHHPVDLAHIKEIFTRLNTLIPSAEEVRGLHDLEFLPVRSPDSGVRLLRVADTFFIADRIEYTRLFQGKVPTLDFSLKECHRYRPLLRSLGLNDRYMSVAVQEETFVDQPSQEHSPRLTRQFRRRAHAIYRCILHYKDDEPVDTLHRLLGATLHESDGFKRSLLLQLNDVRAEVQSNSGSVHIEEVDDRLQIYIPRTPEERQRCYSLHLPKALQHHFRVRAAEAQFTFPLVFLSSEALIDQVLDSCGIVGIPEDIPQQPFQRPGEEGDSYDESSIGESDTDTRVYTPASSPAHGGSPEETPTIPHYNGASPRARRFSSIRYARTPEPRPITIFHEQPPPYVRLLENVTSTARQHTLAEFLQNHPNHTTSIADVAHESAFGPRSQKQLEHDIKIGAAGELFVFELLLAENLPNFTRANWQSTIRKHVSVHPDYQDMRPWNGVETADIVYPDTSSSVTSILVDAGYLDEEWAGTHPTYYVEVKTTTGECDGAFFMSRAQYMRMGRMHLQHPDQANFDIYLIFRVHHLGKRNMGVQLYVDPEGMRQEGSLVFRSESYSVRPGAPTQ